MYSILCLNILLISLNKLLQGCDWLLTSAKWKCSICAFPGQGPILWVCILLSECFHMNEVSPLHLAYDQPSMKHRPLQIKCNHLSAQRGFNPKHHSSCKNVEKDCQGKFMPSQEVWCNSHHQNEDAWNHCIIVHNSLIVHIYIYRERERERAPFNVLSGVSGHAVIQIKLAD